MTGTAEKLHRVQLTPGLLRIFCATLPLLICNACVASHPPLLPEEQPRASSTYVTPQMLAIANWRNTEAGLVSVVKQAKPFVVAVLPEGRTRGGSGCIVSENGLILSAAHVVNLLKPGEKEFTVRCSDGTKAKAVPLGVNFTSDLALMKIVEPAGKIWPHAEIASGSPAVASPVCFLGYPGKYQEGVESHVRFGFITYKRRSSLPLGNVTLIICDAPIQPGDSGGPLFSMEGKLIAIASSAGAPLNYNRFVPVEQYYRDATRLKQGERWGDITKGPTRTKLKHRLDKTGVDRLRTEFDRRLSAGNWPDTIVLAQKTTRTDGSVSPTAQQLVDMFGTDIEPLTLAQPFSAGKKTPEPPPPVTQACKQLTATVAELKKGTDTIGFGVAVGPTALVVKNSLLATGVKVSIDGKQFSFKVTNTDPELDLALIKIGGAEPMIPVTWHESKPLPGTIIIACAAKPIGWGIISSNLVKTSDDDDKAGPIAKNMVSGHRGPYKQVVMHDIPVYAKDMGSVVLDLQGNVIGFNIARKNRTQALMLPAKLMADTIQTMNRQEPQAE